jgi:hypothetical protein
MLGFQRCRVSAGAEQVVGNRWASGPTLTRRRLLAAASAGAAVQVFGGGVVWAQGAAPKGQVRPLSVGYLEGSDLLRSLGAQPWRRGGKAAGGLRVVPAAQMPLGDQNLALSTVEMRVHGFYPGIPPKRLAPFTSLVLTVFFPSDDPLYPDPFAFYSWQGKLWPGPSKSPPIRFLVPLRHDGGLELVLEVFDGRPTGLGQAAARVIRGGDGAAVPLSTPLELRSLYTDFTVDWYGGRPKLQRGFYFLGLEPGAWRAPWDLPGALEARKRPPHDRTSLVVSFEGVPEDDPRLVAASGLR